MSHNSRDILPSKTTTPTFNQVFAAWRWVLNNCQVPDPHTGSNPEPIPVGDFAIACFAYTWLKAMGHLRPASESAEGAHVEHQVHQMQVFLDPLGAAGYIPPGLKEESDTHLIGHVLHTWASVPASTIDSMQSPPARVSVQIRLRDPLISHLILNPANLGPLAFVQNLSTPGTTSSISLFKSIILLFLELLAWHQDRNDRHLLNIKVLFEAEAYAKQNPGKGWVAHESLSPVAIHAVAPYLNYPAVALAIETLDLVARHHVAIAAGWEWNNLPGLASVTSKETLTQGWDNVLSGLRVLLEGCVHWPGHLQKYHTISAFREARDGGVSHRQERSVGRDGRRRERRRSFTGGRDEW